MTLRLITLGRVELHDPARPETALGALQPRRMALLAFLATDDGGRFHRRDLVTAMFWPESDVDRARHALRQTIYGLRQMAGEGLVMSRGQEEIGIGEDVLSCDAAELQQFHEAGQYEEVVNRYKGDFLAGLHVTGMADEFEDWLTTHRALFRSRALAAAITLAQRAEQKGELDQAARWLGRAVDIDPIKEGTYRSLIRVLMTAGETGRAREVFEMLSQRLRRDLDSEPSAATRVLLEPQVAGRQLQEAGVVDSSPGMAAIAVPRRKSSRWPIAAGLMLAMAGGAFIPGLMQRPAPPEVVAVTGFATTDGTDRSNIAIADLLSNGLARLTSRLQVISGPRLLELESRLPDTSSGTRSLRLATAAGATLLVRGQISGTDTLRQLDLQVIDVTSGRIEFATRTAARDLIALADSAALRLALFFQAPPPEAPVSAATTRSLVAYRLYEEGLRSYYTGNALASLRHFQQALGEDSLFAMAAYYGAIAARAQGDADAHQDMLRRMAALAPSLPDRDRLLLQAAVTLAATDPSTKVLTDSLVQRWPGDPDAEMLRAQAYSMFSLDLAESNASAMRALTLDPWSGRDDQLPCRRCEAYIRLALNQLAMNQMEAAERTARSFLAGSPTQPSAHTLLAGILARLDRYPESIRESAIADSLTGTISAPDIERLIRSGQPAVAEVELERWSASTIPGLRQDSRWWLTISLRTQGRFDAAITLLRDGITPAGHRFPPDVPGDSTLQSVVLCESGRHREGATMLSAVAGPAIKGSAAPFHQARRRSWVLTHAATCHALAGDTTALGSLADSIAAEVAITGSPRHLGLPHYVRGLLLRARGDLPGALEEQRKAYVYPVEGFTRVNYEMAGILLQLKRPREAIEPLQAAVRASLQSGGLYLNRADAELLLARAFEATGQMDSARVHHAWVTAARTPGTSLNH